VNVGIGSATTAYGRKIAPTIGWRRFVIDTSRNGLGPATGIDEPWCNPPGRALGASPSAATADALVDAYLWIKDPRPTVPATAAHHRYVVARLAIGLAQRAA
jgi:cellulase/cellobiase CelA1